MPKLGQKASPAAEVYLDGAFVPEEGLIAREGFALAMRVFNRSRPMVAALAVGLLRRALEEALAYAAIREAFGRPLLEHEGVGFKLAEMHMDLEAARLLTPDYTLSRCPNVAGTLPARLYGKAQGLARLEAAREVIRWAEAGLNA